jgi:NAD-dependent SIR2 family protein deacetylase
LVELERCGIVKMVLMTNFDDLHQSAGSVCVKEIGPGDNGAADLRGKVLLAAGVSRDEHGLLRAARAAGMVIVVVNPEIPDFVQEADLYLQGRAEVVLPELVSCLEPQAPNRSSE